MLAMGAWDSEFPNRVTDAVPQPLRVMPVTTGAEVSPAMSTVFAPVMVRPLASPAEHTMSSLSIFTVPLAVMLWVPLAEASSAFFPLPLIATSTALDTVSGPNTAMPLLLTISTFPPALRVTAHSLPPSPAISGRLPLPVIVTSRPAVTFRLGAATVETETAEFAVVSMITVPPLSVTGLLGVYTALFLAEEIRILPPVVRSSFTFWTAEAFALSKIMLAENSSAVVSVL